MPYRANQCRYRNCSLKQAIRTPQLVKEKLATETQLAGANADRAPCNKRSTPYGRRIRRRSQNVYVRSSKARPRNRNPNTHPYPPKCLIATKNTKSDPIHITKSYLEAPALTRDKERKETQRGEPFLMVLLDYDTLGRETVGLRRRNQAAICRQMVR